MKNEPAVITPPKVVITSEPPQTKEEIEALLQDIPGDLNHQFKKPMENEKDSMRIL